MAAGDAARGTFGANCGEIVAVDFLDGARGRPHPVAMAGAGGGRDRGRRRRGDIRETVGFALRREGYRVEVYPDGLEAWEPFERSFPTWSSSTS